MLNVPVVRPTSAGKKHALIAGSPITLEHRPYRGEVAMTVSAGPRLGWLPS